jgi:pSer/pThr/pTyr-binding forkhead associated (FHA) protein
MKITTEGMPLQFLTIEHHLSAICNYQHPYLLVNETDEDYNVDVTPVVESLFINPDILSNFSSPNTRAIPLKKGYRNLLSSIIIGRSEDCDVQIKRKEVSAKHAALHVIESNWYIEDLGSRNGCFLNNEKIKSGDLKRLESQQMISLGGHVGAIFIKAIDLEMLCAMLPSYWEQLNLETFTSEFKTAEITAPMGL